MLKNFYPSIDADYMRQCAITYNWFTRGDNEEYIAWLNMAAHGHKVTPAWLYKAAKMAMQYSDLETLGYSDEDEEYVVDNFSAILLSYASIKYSK